MTVSNAQNKVNEQVQFGRVPTAVIASGAFGPLSPAAGSVYLRLCAASNREWQCSVGQRRIASDMGLHIDTVNEAIKSLHDAGLIVHHNPGNGRRSTYTITTNRSGESERFEANNRSGKSERSKGQAFGFSEQTVRIEQGNRSGESEHVQIEQINQTEGCAAADDERFRQVIEALGKAGIGEPTRERLAKNPYVTAQLVEDLATTASYNRWGIGLIIRKIEERAKHDQAKHQTEEERQRKADQRERRRIDALRRLADELADEAAPHQALADAWWEALSDDEKRAYCDWGIPNIHPARERQDGVHRGRCMEAHNLPPLRYAAWKAVKEAEDARKQRAAERAQKQAHAEEHKPMTKAERDAKIAEVKAAVAARRESNDEVTA